MLKIKLGDMKLSGVEFLLVTMQVDQGRPQTHYLRLKHMYLHGSENKKGNRGSEYFRSSSYRDVLWYDGSVTEAKIPYQTTWEGLKLKVRSCEMFLTKRGWERANAVRVRIGLSPLPLKSQWVALEDGTEWELSGGHFICSMG